MTETERIREEIYNIVLAARTEGIISGKTKRFAGWDTDQILAIKGLRVEAEDQSLPESTDSEMIDYGSGYSHAQQDMLKDKWFKGE